MNGNDIFVTSGANTLHYVDGELRAVVLTTNLAMYKASLAALDQFPATGAAAPEYIAGDNFILANTWGNQSALLGDGPITSLRMLFTGSANVRFRSFCTSARTFNLYHNTNLIATIPVGAEAYHQYTIGGIVPGSKIRWRTTATGLGDMVTIDSIKLGFASWPPNAWGLAPESEMLRILDDGIYG